MRPGIAAAVLLLATGDVCAQEVRERHVEIFALDNTKVLGVAKVPTTAMVKTKFGELKLDFETVTSMSRQPDKSWNLTTRTGNVVGTLDLKTMEVKTTEGLLELDMSQVQLLHFIAPPAPKPALPPKDPVFKGHEFRSSHDPQKEAITGVHPALLMSGGKHVAILDIAQEACVFVDLATGACTCVKVEGGPCSLAEKDGKVYVANARSASLTIIDSATFKPKGRVSVGAAPSWLSAPVVGNVLYVLTQNDQARIMSLDTRTDRMLPAFAQSGTNSVLMRNQRFVTASPDNRLLIVQGTHGPNAFWISGNKLLNSEVHTASTSLGPVFVDYTGGRVYTGTRMYSLDLRGDLGGDLRCVSLVPHPSRSLVFGVYPPWNTGKYPTSSAVTLFEEEKMTKVGEIQIGDPILALLPSENTLYVLGPTRLYPVDLAPAIPEAVLSKAKPRRVPVDLNRLPAVADVKKAEALFQEGQRLAEAGNADEARKKFDASAELDPLGPGRIGPAMILVRQKSHIEAEQLLQTVARYPFREPSSTALALHLLGTTLTALQRHDHAVQLYWDSLKTDSQSALLLRGLGTAQDASGEPSAAYISWSRSLAADSRQADLRKLLEETLKRIARDTTATCDVCEGDGKMEVFVQEQGKPKQKITKECRLCKGAGKTWKRPCVDCIGQGTKGLRTSCDKCLGDGVIHEPARGK